MAVVTVREGASTAQLARVINTLAAAVAELTAAHNALLVQLDADAGVTDTDYEATHEVTAAADTVTVIY